MVELPQTYFGRYDPWNWGWDQGSIVPFVSHGVSFPGGVHPAAAPIFAAVLDELVPQLPNGLMSPGCWGYSGTSVTVGGSPSFHNFGLAIDVNAPVNPMISSGWYQHEMPEIAGDIARRYGCEWGGWWTSPKDYMHIEVHLDPDGAQSVAAQLAAGATTPPPPPRPPEADVIYILNEERKGDPSSVRVAMLTGTMFVGIGGEEVRHANAMMTKGAVPYQWVESQTWNDLDRRSKYATGIGR